MALLLKKQQDLLTLVKTGNPVFLFLAGITWLDSLPLAYNQALLMSLRSFTSKMGL